MKDIIETTLYSFFSLASLAMVFFILIYSREVYTNSRNFNMPVPKTIRSLLRYTILIDIAITALIITIILLRILINRV